MPLVSIVIPSTMEYSEINDNTIRRVSYENETNDPFRE